MGDGGVWLRKQCMVLAGNNCTGVHFWVSLPLPELSQWIDVNNDMIAAWKEAPHGKPKRI